MEHKHIYDAEGNQLCCTQQEKIYTNAGAEDLLKERHSKNDGHYHGIKSVSYTHLDVYKRQLQRLPYVIVK